MHQAQFIEEPSLLAKHTADSEFIGPATYYMGDNTVLLTVAGGRFLVSSDGGQSPEANVRKFVSRNGGRTWHFSGTLDIERIGDQPAGVSTILRLQDGRLAYLCAQSIPANYGGAFYTLHISDDEGENIQERYEVGGRDSVYYVMNDRLIQMSTGRLILPTSCMPPMEKTYEGHINVALCFHSDDGKTWERSSQWSEIPGGGNDRGLQEACAIEVAGGRLMMLARTGMGSLYQAWSSDGGETWSPPEPTTLVSACSSLTLKRIPDGRLVAVYNHTKPLQPGTFFPRTPLVYATSEDDGQSWSEPFCIDAEGVEDGDRQHVYPSVCPMDEGMLLVYSTHAADPKGTFSNGGREGWRVGGGKSCILAYPD